MTEPRRGDVVVIADRAPGDSAGKPRPAVVMQSDALPETDSVVVCLITSVDRDAPLLRVEIAPSASLPLRAMSWVMTDKLTTVQRSRMGGTVGRLPPEDTLRVERALLVVLGIG